MGGAAQGPEEARRGEPEAVRHGRPQRHARRHPGVFLEDFRKVYDGVSTVGGGEARGVRRKVAKDVSGPLHLPLVPEADAEVDLHAERHRSLQRQGKEGIGQDGVDELAGERAVLHDADCERIQPACEEDTGLGRDDGGGVRGGRDAQVNAAHLFTSHRHVHQRKGFP